jgi:hypothetical protein
VSGEEERARTTALAVTTAEPPKLMFATSLATMKRGEVLLVDRDGRTLTRRTINRRRWLLGGIAATCVATIATVSSAPVVVGAATLLGTLAIKLARPLAIHVANPEFRRGLRFLIANRDAEARPLIEAADAKDRSGDLGASIARAVALLAWRRGEHAEARRHTERALAKASRTGDGAITYWLIAVQRAQLVALHDPEAAMPLIAELADAPDNDYFRAERRFAELAAAFHADRPDRLPADDVLYDWAKDALAVNSGGFRVAALAWVFDARGDAEMAAHLLGEVRSRLLIPTELIPNIDPPLWAWAEPRLPSPNADE